MVWVTDEIYNFAIEFLDKLRYDTKLIFVNCRR